MAGLSVLVTRPPPGLDETMRALVARGHHPIAAPLLRVRPLSPALPATAQAILLTSGQAAAPLAAAAPHLCPLPLLAVGDRTADRAREAGFLWVQSAAGDAAALAALAAATCPPSGGPLLLACGASQGTALAGTLRRSGLRVVRRCLYQARPVRRLPPAASSPFDAALFFSRETAAVFARLSLNRSRLSGVRALAISRHAAEPLLDLGWRGVEVASIPDAAALLSLL